MLILFFRIQCKTLKKRQQCSILKLRPPENEKNLSNIVICFNYLIQINKNTIFFSDSHWKHHHWFNPSSMGLIHLAPSQFHLHSKRYSVCPNYPVLDTLCVCVPGRLLDILHVVPLQATRCPPILQSLYRLIHDPSLLTLPPTPLI